MRLSIPVQFVQDGMCGRVVFFSLISFAASEVASMLMCGKDPAHKKCAVNQSGREWAGSKQDTVGGLIGGYVVVRSQRLKLPCLSTRRSGW
jgi:hypothetical protein